MLPARRGILPKARNGTTSLGVFLGIQGVSEAPLFPLLRDRTFGSRLFLNKLVEASIISGITDSLNKGKLRNNKMTVYD